MNSSLVQQIEALFPITVHECLGPKHGTEIRILMAAFQSFKQGKITPNDLIFESKMVLDYTWEKLNIGKWIDVPVETKQVYSLAAFIQIIGILHENRNDSVRKCLEVVDLGIILGSPLPGLDLTRIAGILSKKIKNEPAKVTFKRLNPENTDHVKKLKLENEIPCIERPSLELFNNNYFSKKEPVKISNCMNHWPALKLWNNLEYLKETAGDRTVPIELGKHYADDSYSQKLMKISDFIEQYFFPNADKVGYLAQHQLFDQVPELKNDIREPEYCALSEKYEETTQDTDINAWFGPKGTVSPLHFDPKHNLLCQVVGSKKLIMYSEKDSKFLYPHDSTLLFNTSRIDVENPDYEKYPEFRNAQKRECVLNPGEMLYIPPKYWHHVRALENSFSVSFWWE